jgi:hypothetical protein
MAEGQSMTVADVVAQVRDARLEDFIREAVALVTRELMEAEIADRFDDRRRGGGGSSATAAPGPVRRRGTPLDNDVPAGRFASVAAASAPVSPRVDVIGDLVLAAGEQIQRVARGPCAAIALHATGGLRIVHDQHEASAFVAAHAAALLLPAPAASAPSPRSRSRCCPPRSANSSPSSRDRRHSHDGSPAAQLATALAQPTGRTSARGTANLLPPIRQALADGCSLGEVCGAMRGVVGECQPQSRGRGTGAPPPRR